MSRRRVGGFAAAEPSRPHGACRWRRLPGCRPRARPGRGASRADRGAGSAPPAGGVEAGRDRAWPELTLPATVRVRVGTTGAARIVTLPLDEYVLGAVRAEMLPSTLRAQPASRAPATCRPSCPEPMPSPISAATPPTSTTCATRRTARCTGQPAAGEGPGDPAARAVSATRGQVLTFQGRVIQALFHADCGGHTASAASVWGGTDAPYLASVGDWYCERQPASGWTYARGSGRGDPRAERGSAHPDRSVVSDASRSRRVPRPAARLPSC